MAFFGKRAASREEPRTQAPVDEFVPPSELPEVEEAAAGNAQDAMPNFMNPLPNLPPHIPSPAPAATPAERAAGSGDNLAPVFVKISKYKDILNSINYLKMGFGVIRNQLSILSRLAKLEKDNMDLMLDALNKVEGRLGKLDADFTKPVDYLREVADMKVQDMHGLETTMDDLKTQIEKLKSEVETLA